MLNTILLQDQAGWANIVMIVVLIAIFYFFMIRPQQKKQNQIKKFREGIKVGDRVVTAGGIYAPSRTPHSHLRYPRMCASPSTRAPYTPLPSRHPRTLPRERKNKR